MTAIQGLCHWSLLFLIFINDVLAGFPFIHGEGSSIVKLPGDVPPARVYFFGLLVWPRVYFLAILVELSLGKGMLFGNFG